MTLAIFGLAPDSQATPKKRLDEASQICRILTFQNSGWASEGSRIFAQSCKSCHTRDNDKGASFLHSESKTMKAWNRVFLEKYPQCAKDGQWANLSQEDLMKLNDYLFRNAANTYNPNDAADCG
jgi:mono/diheme cytochrome c family protein